MLRQRDAIDFYQRVFGQPRGFDGGSCGAVVAHGLGVDFVDGGEVGHAFQEDRGLDDLAQLAAAGFEHGREVFHYLRGLLGGRCADDAAGSWVERDLAGAEDQPVGADGLAVRSDGFGCVFG